MGIEELKTPYKTANQPSFPVDALSKGINLEVIEWAHGFGEYLGTNPGKLTTNQLRKFFGELRRMEAEPPGEGSTPPAPQDLLMLIPKLAYAVGRARKDNNSSKVEDFFKELSHGISRADTYAKFKNFVKIVEAIVAYHKIYEEIKPKK